VKDTRADHDTRIPEPKFPHAPSRARYHRVHCVFRGQKTTSPSQLRSEWKFDGNLRPAARTVQHSTLAHHPFSAEFDATAPVRLQGKVTRIDWRNPHAVIQMSATETNGDRNWTLEAASPSELAQKGWSRDTLKVGDQITVDGFKAKSKPTTASARVIECRAERRCLRLMTATAARSPQIVADHCYGSPGV
jgi:hypothetical protein